MSQQSATDVAILGGGCFWCLEAVYLEARGVTRVESGYMGGTTPAPTYGQVCAGTTGHAEVVGLEFDPDVISYRDILEIFFTIHDPTTQDRQGADVGTQYRSVVLYHSNEQRDDTKAVIDELTREKVWDDPIVTQIVPLTTFYSAEEYHQDYYSSNAAQPYCQIVIAPKVAKFRKKYLDRLSRR